MKKIIFGSLLLGFMAIALLNSCKKEIELETVTQNEIKPDKIGIYYSYGRIVYMDDYGNQTVIGYYMRTLKDHMFFGYGCWDPATNCLPDHDVGQSPYDGNDNNQNIENEIENFGVEIAGAVNNGNTGILNFFNNKLAPVTQFPEQLISDFNNGSLTIKKFEGRYFIVNTNATSHNDFPQYD
ncbi:MAG: hypothetical protein ACPGVD_09720 [Flavobacteriales bacterium]